MAKDPIIFAMANPDPEIRPELAKEARKDVIIATGRSDYANQVNNVLGFPFIFRGALDVRAKQINEDMKFAASKALSALAKEDVPDSVIRAYGGEPIKFGREYIIPTPLDPRVLLWEAPAVAEMAMKTGMARKTIDIDEYRNSWRSVRARVSGFVISSRTKRALRVGRSAWRLRKAKSRRSSARRIRFKKKALPLRC
jgi:malate dehydrogenase (oxaloacetate-decarboxylating)(NADP+)